MVKVQFDTRRQHNATTAFKMPKLFLYICMLIYASMYVQSATVVHHQPVIFHHHPFAIPTDLEVDSSVQEPHEQHPGYTIVAPLTKIAHVTYDSFPISHTPFEYAPLFHRIGHLKNIRF